MTRTSPWGAGAAILAIATLGISGCAATESEPDSSTITIATPTDGGLNPLTSGFYLNLPMQATYDRLVEIEGAGGRFAYNAPSLATEWTLSDDRLRLDFTLRDDVDFLDGEHMDAEGVIEVLTTMLDGPVYGAVKEVFAPELEVTGEYSFSITTTTPANQLFMGMLGTVILSPAALDNADLDEVPVGSGPYLIDQENSTPGVEMRFTRNPDYWNPERFPYDEVILKSFADPVAALNALKSGQVDATGIDLAAAAEAESAGFKVTTVTVHYRGLFLGDRAGEILPAIGDVRVRQAINLAFDREAINEAMDLGYGAVSSQVFMPGQDGYVESRDDTYGYDPDRARELLAEAGYPDGFDLTIPSAPLLGMTEMEPIVQQYLGDIGIRVTFESFPDGGAWFAAASQYPVMMIRDLYFTVMGNFLAPGGWGVGLWDYQDENVLELVRTIDGGTDEEAVQAKEDLAQYLLDEAWFAPFSRSPTAWASIPEVAIELDFTAGQQLSLFRPAD